MYTKTITYTDFDGNERTEKFYFNLTQEELMELDLSTDGGFEQYIQRIISAQNNKELYKQFKSIILMAYGEKSLDGRRFIKNEQLREEFKQTQAFSDMIIEFATEPDKASAFINQIVPAVKEASPVPATK